MTFERTHLSVRPADRPRPIAGRVAELGVLNRQLNEALSSRGSLVLIDGEAGIGKTRLVEELLRMAGATGCQVMSGRCLPGHSYPFLPFEEAFHNRVSRDPMQAGPESGEADEPFSFYMEGNDRSAQKPDRERVLFAALDHLKAVSLRQPLVLFLDDIHWADPSSLLLLDVLARNLQRHPVLIIGTYRTEELTPPSEGSTSLIDSLRKIRREGLCHEVHLEPLGAGEIRLAIERYVNAPVDTDVSAAIETESQGNPLFALETFMLLVNTNQVHLRNGSWAAVSGLHISIPSTVREVIMRRLDQLSEAQRKVLECASVVGPQFDPTVISEILGIRKIDLLEVMEPLDQQYHLIRERDDGFIFCHQKTCYISYEGISRQRRKELHRKVGEILERAVLEEVQYGVLSQHFYKAGVYPKCLRYSLLAGEMCIKRYAGSEAITYFQRALWAIESDETLRPQRLRALEGLADSHHDLCDFESSYSIYEGVLPEVSEANVRARVLRKCYECWDPSRLGNGQVDRCAEFLEEANRISDVDLLEKAEILSGLGMVSTWRGDNVLAEKYRSEAITIFGELGAHTRVAWELLVSSAADLRMDNVEAAYDKAVKAEDIFKKHPWLWAEQYADQLLGRIFLTRGAYSDAIERFEAVIDKGTKLGEHCESAYANYYKAIIYEVCGEREKAFELAVKSLDNAMNYGLGALASIPLTLIVHLFCLKGDIIAAENMFQRSVENVKGADQSIRTPLWGLLAFAGSELLLAKGGVDEAEKELNRSVSLLHGELLGTYYEGAVRLWYSELCEALKVPSEPDDLLNRGLAIFLGLSNTTMADIVAERIKASHRS